MFLLSSTKISGVADLVTYPPLSKSSPLVTYLSLLLSFQFMLYYWKVILCQISAQALEQFIFVDFTLTFILYVKDLTSQRLYFLALVGGGVLQIFWRMILNQEGYN